ncbi:MAG: FAD-binding oxidoreductase, partial [Terriglobia bacterium]
DLLDPGAAKLLSLPSLSPDHWSLVVTVGGVDKVIRRYADDFSALAREQAVAAFGVVRDEAEHALRSAERELIPRARQAHARATVVKVTLPFTQIGPFLAKGRTVAERYQLPSAASAHAGSGIGYVYLLPAEGMKEAPHRMAQAATELIHAGNNLSGRVTVPWCVTEVKRDVNVWGPLRDDFALMQKLKAQFDPDNILNPGRFLGGL